MDVETIGISLPRRSIRENNLYDKLVDALENEELTKKSAETGDRYALVCGVTATQKSELIARLRIRNERTGAVVPLPEPTFTLDEECFENGRLNAELFRAIYVAFSRADPAKLFAGH